MRPPRCSSHAWRTIALEQRAQLELAADRLDDLAQALALAQEATGVGVGAVRGIGAWVSIMRTPRGIWGAGEGPPRRLPAVVTSTSRTWPRISPPG